jgi:enamine deaminase RidA (YjgF/YER057c/UK114 family)
VTSACGTSFISLTTFGDHKAADVVLGVAALSPGYLIEVDAIAIID